MAEANFFSPNTPIDPRKALQYAQQQALAKAMMDEGNAPIDASKYQIGGVAFAASPLEGLAKALKSGVGAYQSKELQDSYSKDVASYQSALANALKGGDLQSMIAASADNPMLAEFGKDLALSKAKSDYEVNKLMAIEGMKASLDPNKMRMRNAQAIVNGGPPNNSYQGLPEPSVNSQPLPPPSGMGNDMNLPPLPHGALQQPAPMIGSVPMPPSPNQAMGAMVDAQGNQPDAAFNASPPPQSAPQADYGYHNAYLTLNPNIKPPDGMIFQRGANGQPTLTPEPNAKLDDSQSKAAGFYERMIEADPIISNNAAEGTDVGNISKGSIPLIGNMLVPEGYQKFDQAKRNFVNAVLRRESGAVISPSEFENASKQYFPQAGDKPDVLAQKQQNRTTAMQGILQAAGPSYKPKAQPSPANVPLKINSDEEYNRLPSGTQFTAPDGSQRVKP